ncbi:hypothetical protein RUND412_001422 [Rhizina undulata]
MTAFVDPSSILAIMSILAQVSMEVAVSMAYVGLTAALESSSSSPAIAEKNFLNNLAAMNFAVIFTTLYEQAVSSVCSTAGLTHITTIALPAVQKSQIMFKEAKLEAGEAVLAVETPAASEVTVPVQEVHVQETNPVKSNEDTVEAINPIIPTTTTTTPIPVPNQTSTTICDAELPPQKTIRNSLIEEFDSLCSVPNTPPTTANNEAEGSVFRYFMNDTEDKQEKMLSRDIEEKITVEVARIIEAQRVKVEQCVVKFSNRSESQKTKEAKAEIPAPISKDIPVAVPEAKEPKPVVVNIEITECEDSDGEESICEQPQSLSQDFEPEKHLDNTSQDSFDSSYDSESEGDRSAMGSPPMSPVSSVCGDTDVWPDAKALEAVPVDLDTRVLGDLEALSHENSSQTSLEEELRQNLENELLSRVKETPSRPVSRDGPRMFFRSKSSASSVYSQPSRKPSAERFYKPSVEAPKTAFTFPQSILDRPLPPLPKSEVLVQQQPACVEKSMIYAPFQTWSRAVAKTIERKSLMTPKRTIVSVAKKLQRAPKKKVPLKARLSSSSKRNFLSKPFW